MHAASNLRERFIVLSLPHVFEQEVSGLDFSPHPIFTPEECLMKQISPIFENLFQILQKGLLPISEDLRKNHIAAKTLFKLTKTTSINKTLTNQKVN